MGKYVSFSGLDLSFLKDGDVSLELSPWEQQIKDLKARASSRPSRRSSIACPFLMQDIKPFVSPIDGKEITSRSKLRAHELQHNVKQCGDYKRGEVVAIEDKRVAETKRLADMESITWSDLTP